MLLCLLFLIGGGKNIKPGSISLAHKGVLFIDEAGEFPSHILDSLRQPWRINILLSIANSIAIYPCDFQLILASNFVLADILVLKLIFVNVVLIN